MKIQNPNFSFFEWMHRRTPTDGQTSPKQNAPSLNFISNLTFLFFFRDIKFILTRILTMDINYGNLNNIFYTSI